MLDFGNIGNKVTRTYPRTAESVQSTAYALREYLDLKKDMITQTMRTKTGYTIQCKGDAAAEWTKFLGMDAALAVDFEQTDDTLKVSIGFEKWMEKLGIAAAGAVFFHPLILTAGIGALRQAALTDEIFTFIEEYLNVSPIVREPEPAAEPLRAAEQPEAQPNVCPNCGTENRIGAIYCKACGSSLVKEKKYCPHCNAELDGDEAFCPFCGEKLN